MTSITASSSIDASHLEASRRPHRALEALNFFMADRQAGIGSLLGVFLSQKGSTTAPIGTVTTVGGVAGMRILAASLSFCHLCNGAMQPRYGLAVVDAMAREARA